jgi:hypothetical protein
MTTKPARRRLDLLTLNDIRSEVQRLQSGAQMAGNWTLAQIFNHLEMAFRFSLDGFERSTVVSELVRLTIGRLFRYMMLERRYIPTGAPLPKHLQPPLGTPALEEAQRLLAAIDRFERTPNEHIVHPILGRFTREQWIVYHCVHCAHHLSFAIPLPAAEAVGTPGSHG